MKEDKCRFIKLTRVDPNMSKGIFIYEKILTQKQLNDIEKILEINLKDYNEN